MFTGFQVVCETCSAGLKARVLVHLKNLHVVHCPAPELFDRRVYVKKGAQVCATMVRARAPAMRKNTATKEGRAESGSSRWWVLCTSAARRGRDTTLASSDSAMIGSALDLDTA